MNAVQYVFSVVKSCTHDYTCDNEWKRGTVTSRLRKTERVGINFAFFKERRMFLTTSTGTSSTKMSAIDRLDRLDIFYCCVAISLPTNSVPKKVTGWM